MGVWEIWERFHFKLPLPETPIRYNKFLLNAIFAGDLIPTMDQQEKNILVVTCFGHFLSHFNMLVFPAVVLPLAGRLGLELGAVLSLSFGQYLLFGVTALPWGMAADRWGSKRFMLLYFFGAGLSALAAAAFIDEPAIMALALAGIGLFSGIYHPTGLGLISKGIKRLSMGMGVNGMFGNLGLAVAPLLAGLINWIWGPRGVYVGVGCLNLIGLAIMFFLRLDEPEESAEKEKKGQTNLVKPFLILLAAMMLGGVAYRGATVILPTYFELKGQGIYQALISIWPSGVSANLVATTLTSIIFFIGILGQFTGGRVGERFEARKAYLVFHLLTLPPVFLLAYLQDSLLVLASLVYFFFLLGMQPVENTLVARLTPRRFHHSAYGAKFVLTFGVGALAVKLVGRIELSWGITSVFPVLGLVSVGLILAVLVLMTQTKPVLPPERQVEASPIRDAEAAAGIG